MVAFSKTRNTENSVIDGIEAGINASWTGITTVKSFVKAYDYAVPVVCVRMLSTESFRTEIGANTLRHQSTFVVDIFAKSDGQRIDLADFIVNLVKDGFVYYEYSKASGNPEELDKTANGRIILLNFVGDSRIDSYDGAEEHDKFRHSISFTVEKF